MGKMKPPASMKMIKNMMDNWRTSEQRFQLHLPAVSNTEKASMQKVLSLKVAWLKAFGS